LGFGFDIRGDLDLLFLSFKCRFLLLDLFLLELLDLLLFLGLLDRLLPLRILGDHEKEAVSLLGGETPTSLLLLQRPLAGEN